MCLRLFGNKDIESLKLENKRLTEKIETLEACLNSQGKNLEELKSALQKAEEIAEASAKYTASLVETVRRKDAEIAEISGLLTAASIRPHNERVAGRKRKATQEQARMILLLKNEGKSYAQIARTLIDLFGGDWNRFTVRNTHLSVNN